MSGFTGTTWNEVGSTSGLIAVDHLGLVAEEVLEVLERLLLVDVLEPVDLGVVRRASVSSASRWASWIFGSMKMISSMPPSHWRGGLVEPLADEERHADEHEGDRRP